MNPFWTAYGCYSDDSAWEDSWIIDSDITYLGRKTVKLDCSKVGQLAAAFSGENVNPERADLIVDKETGFTLLLDWECLVKGKSESLHYQITEFDVNTDIPDSMFNLPAGMRRVDF